MILQGIQRYKDNFKGFSKEIWILTLITFINRAGTMVLPFLSKYLHEDLHFELPQVGTIMLCYGFGSMLGSWLGGKLTDTIGFYKIMNFSLFTTGIIFLILQYVTSFVGLCIGMFIIMTIADMYRPAMFVSIGAYTTKETRTKALTLIRLAINLGFGAGPAMGGLIIMALGYKALFWIDGITCIVAILIFWLNVKEKKKSKLANKIEPGEVLTTSVFKDKIYWLFLLCCTIAGILFFQLFTTIPLYEKKQFNLTEFQTGLLFMLNGFIIFLLEMPIVSYVERKKISLIKIINIGLLIMSVSLFLLVYKQWAGVLVIMMILMSFGEMFIFPFSNSFAMSRAQKGHEGRYMAIFTMSFSLAHIISSKLGLAIVDYFKNYENNWIFMGILGLFAYLIGLWINKLLITESQILKK